MQSCCSLREQLSHERQAARSRSKALEKELQDSKLEVVALQARLAATEDQVALSDAEVQRLMQATSDVDLTQARAVMLMESTVIKVNKQAAAYKDEIRSLQVRTKLPCPILSSAAVCTSNQLFV